MSAVQRGLGLFGAVAALLVGMFSTPAAAAPLQYAAPLQEAGCAIFPAPGAPSLQVTPIYDPEFGNLERVWAAWAGSVGCVPPFPAPNAIVEVDFESQLWWEEVVPVGLDQDECSLVEGDPNCDSIITGGNYLCEEAEDGPCHGRYHASYIVHVVMAPGIVWGDLPDICDETRPAPLQVVDCVSFSHTVIVDPFE
jgi:hypothetical protein